MPAVVQSFRRLVCRATEQTWAAKGVRIAGALRDTGQKYVTLAAAFALDLRFAFLAIKPESKHLPHCSQPSPSGKAEILVAGQQLKLLRNKRNITVREVEQASQRIADAKGDKRFRISNAWLAQLENGDSEPSICKLFSLSVIYHANLLDLLDLYNIDVGNTDKYESVANPHLTQLLSPTCIADLRPDVTSSTATNLVSQLTRSQEPFICGQGNGNSHLTCGYLGSTDLTMSPLIRPGSLVRIDTTQDKLQNTSWRNEFERPIYFVELRDGYACGWCELQGNQLLVIPHHSSPATIRRFLYPREAEIVGRVVGYYTRCVESEEFALTSQRRTRA